MSCANRARNAPRSKPGGSAPMSPSSLAIAIVGVSAKAKCHGVRHPVQLDAGHVARDPFGMESRHEKAIAFGFLERHGDPYLGQG